MAKKVGILKKLTTKKCFTCGKRVPKNKSGLMHHVQNSYGQWKQVCASCKTTLNGRSTKPMFRR